MKNLFIISILFLILSCQEEGDLTKRVEGTQISPNAILKYKGLFEPTDGIMVSGEAKIFQEGNRYKLSLDAFDVSSGPDLKVYLSKSATPSEFVNLGNLTSQTVYLIPDNIVIADYSHVLIHCQQYSHLFAVAALTQN